MAKTVYILVKGKVGLTPPNSTFIFDNLGFDESDIEKENFYSSYKSPYNMFGHWEVIYNKNRPVTFTCVEPSIILTLSSENFKHYAEHTMKKMLYNVMKSLSGIVYFDGWHETAIGDF